MPTNSTELSRAGPPPPFPSGRSGLRALCRAGRTSTRAAAQELLSSHTVPAAPQIAATGRERSTLPRCRKDGASTDLRRKKRTTTEEEQGTRHRASPLLEAPCEIGQEGGVADLLHPPAPDPSTSGDPPPLTGAGGWGAREEVTAELPRAGTP
jgi:hypothetical protein